MVAPIFALVPELCVSIDHAEVVSRLFLSHPRPIPLRGLRFDWSDNEPHV